MNTQIKIVKVGNHWYLSINHELGYISGFDEKIDKYLNILDLSKCGNLTLEFEEIGVIVAGINIVYFNEDDILRYFTTDDDFNLRFMINNHEFFINSDLYWLLENQYNFNFHKSMYRIHIF